MSVLARKAGEEGDPSPQAMGEVRGSLDMRVIAGERTSLSVWIE